MCIRDRGYTIEIKVRSFGDDLNATAIQNVQSFLISQTQYHVEVKETTHSTGLFQIGNSTPAELFQLLEELSLIHISEPTRPY